MRKNLHSVSMLSALSLSLVSFVPGSLLARTDCPHSIRLNDLKKIAEKNQGDKIINTIGEEWTIESSTPPLAAVLKFLEDDPKTTNRSLSTTLKNTQHTASMAHSGAKMEEKLICEYLVTGFHIYETPIRKIGKNQNAGVTMSYYHPD